VVTASVGWISGSAPECASPELGTCTAIHANQYGPVAGPELDGRIYSNSVCHSSPLVLAITLRRFLSGSSCTWTKRRWSSRFGRWWAMPA
jgi:hypothetical protein